MCEIFEMILCIHDTQGRVALTSSKKGILSGHLVETRGSGFVIHLQVQLSEEEMLLGYFGVDRAEVDVVTHVVNGMEVVEDE